MDKGTLASDYQRGSWVRKRYFWTVPCHLECPGRWSGARWRGSVKRVGIRLFRESTEHARRPCRVLIAPQRTGRWADPNCQAHEVTRPSSALHPSFEFFEASAGHTTTLNFFGAWTHQLRIEPGAGNLPLGNVLDQLDGGPRVFALFPQNAARDWQGTTLCLRHLPTSRRNTPRSQQPALTTRRPSLRIWLLGIAMATTYRSKIDAPPGKPQLGNYTVKGR